MFRPFMRTPAEFLVESSKKEVVSERAKILKLPVWVLDIIFDHLEVLDRCSVALSCKTLLRYAHSNEQLDYIIQHPPRVLDLKHFFEDQLGRGWIPTTLRYCSDCGKFVSTSSIHWRHVSERYTREFSGRVSELWRQRRDDGWLRYWIERWCANEEDMLALTMKLRDKTTLICPKCSIQNPECNQLRQERVDLQKSPTSLEHPKRPIMTYQVERQRFHSSKPYSTAGLAINFMTPQAMRTNY